jgi:hypothetical protein
MTTINIHYNGVETPIVLEDVAEDGDPYAYLYNRVTQDQHNALAAADKYALLTKVFTAANIPPGWTSLEIWVDNGSGPEKYTLYSDFSNAKLTTDRNYYEGATSGTDPDDLYLGAAVKYPAIIALSLATGTIPDGDISGTAISGDYFNELLDDGTTGNQAPRLLWGLADTNDGDFAGQRFPSNMTDIYVS